MGSIQRLPSAGSVEHGYPEGHLGNLTEKEEQALKDFKAFVEDKGLYKPGPPASHDDPTLLRYLRARKWVVEDAYGQFSETEKFRKANEIDVLYDTIDVDSYEASRKLYPRYTGRRDRRGIPIYVYQIKHLDSSAVAAYEKSTSTTYSKAKTDGKTPAKLLRLFALYENLTRFVQPLCSQCVDRDHAKVPITLSTNIVDISGVSLRMFWNLKAHMQVASELATSHYPETLDRIFIVGAPAFFSTVWAWIKRWFDPVTVSKIFILGPADVIPVLSKFMDLKDIPKVYGGELDWTFFEEPAWDDEILKICQWRNGHTTFPLGPLYWRPTADEKQLECVAVGSNGEKQRDEVVCVIDRPFPPKTPEEIAAEEASKAAASSKEGTDSSEAKPTNDTEVATDGMAKLAVQDEGGVD